MAAGKVNRAVGLMAGTSLDGVDVAVLETDGAAHIRPLSHEFYPYSSAVRSAVRACLGRDYRDPQVERLVTAAHLDAVRSLAAGADVIGFHGQTVFHDPAAGRTLQLGEAQWLADRAGCVVVSDFRSADLAAGGQGAPLLPVYHRARVVGDDLRLPVVIVNIGGVSNVTWVGGPEERDVLAFDCGPGNAMMDDHVLAETGQPYDADGKSAAQGCVDQGLLRRWCADPYFVRSVPKSLDRDAWNLPGLETLSFVDALATLSAFTVHGIARSSVFFKEKPTAWYVAGGGRHNAHLMTGLGGALDGRVAAVEALGWHGDGLEAEGFAYLAVRSLRGLPLSFPGTTGAVAAQCGGVTSVPFVGRRGGAGH